MSIHDPVFLTQAERSKLIAEVEAEFRPGGRPADVMCRLGISHLITPQEAVWLTNNVFRSYEDRLAALEEKLV